MSLFYFGNNCRLTDTCASVFYPCLCVHFLLIVGYEKMEKETKIVTKSSFLKRKKSAIMAQLDIN